MVDTAITNPAFNLRELGNFLAKDNGILREHDFLFGRGGLVKEWFLKSLDARVDISSFVDPSLSHEILRVLKVRRQAILNTEPERAAPNTEWKATASRSIVADSIRKAAPTVWHTLKLVAHRISEYIQELTAELNKESRSGKTSFGVCKKISGLGNIAVNNKIPILANFDSGDCAFLPIVAKSSIFLYELIGSALSDFGIAFECYESERSGFLKVRIEPTNADTSEVIDPEMLGVIVGVCHYTGTTLDQDFIVASPQILLPLDTTNAFAPSRLKLQDRVENIARCSAIDIDRIMHDDPSCYPRLFFTSPIDPDIRKGFLFDQVNVENYAEFRSGFEFAAKWISKNQKAISRRILEKDFSAIFSPRCRSTYENFIYNNLEQIHSGRRKTSVRNSLEAMLGLSSYELDGALRQQLESLLTFQVPRWVVSATESRLKHADVEFTSDGLSTFTQLADSVRDGDSRRQMRALFHLLFRTTSLEIPLPGDNDPESPSALMASEVMANALNVILQHTVSSDGRLCNRELVPATATENGPMKQSFNLYYGYAGILLAGSEAVRAGIEVSADARKRLVALSKIVFNKFHELIHIVSPSYFGGSLGILASLLSAQRAGILGTQQLKFEKIFSTISAKVQELDFLDIIEGISGIAICLRNLSRYEASLQNNTSIKAMIDICERTIRSSAANDPFSFGLYGDISAGLPLAGVSHGIQGIKLAVALTFDHPEKFYSSIPAFGGQDRLFSLQHNNWKDTRVIETAPYEANSWCHGAEGFVLTETMVSAERGIELVSLPREFNLLRWLETSKNVRASWGLCHGAAGRLVTLNELQNHLLSFDSSELSRRINATRAGLAASMIQRLQDALDNSAIDYHNHNLMTGISGDIFALTQFMNYSSCANPLLLRT